MALTILVTGFGRFPGVPVNPTGPLVRKLARTVRLPCVKITAHVFETSYDAVDSELPKLIAQHKPDVMLMFGLATRTRLVRVEVLARNVVALLPGKLSQRHTIAPGGPATRAMPAPTRALLAALRAAHVPATLSHDAGGYLCNYLCWRGVEVTKRTDGPRLAAFIHVPRIRGGNSHAKRLTINDLTRAGSGALAALAAAARR